MGERRLSIRPDGASAEVTLSEFLEIRMGKIIALGEQPGIMV